MGWERGKEGEGNLSMFLIYGGVDLVEEKFKCLEDGISLGWGG